MSEPLLSVRGLTKRFGKGTRVHTAVNDVSFDLHGGEVLGLVGESGCGKSTTLRSIVGLERPDEGEITYDGINVLGASKGDLERYRREVQLVFQDPYSSLNPRMTVEKIVSEPLLVHGDFSKAQRRDKAVEILEMVGLASTHLDRYPKSFSGGQRQRIAIARALVVQPRILICDEPVSALDVSVQAQVLNLIKDMKSRLNLSVLFIAHDLSVVRYLCSRLVVLQNGVTVETGTRDEVYDSPRHPYTQELLRAVPRPDPELERSRRSERRLLSSNSLTGLARKA